jgi:hypothetical protein
MKFNKALSRVLLLGIALGFGCAPSAGTLTFTPSSSGSGSSTTTSSGSGSSGTGSSGVSGTGTSQFNGTSYSPVGTYTSNQMTIYVNSTNSAGCGTTNPQYVNEPCVSVTICSPNNTSECQTINDVLLDTGSYGLRLFSSVITIPLVPVTSGTDTLAECTSYLDGSSQWGQVEYAYVQLAGEPMVGVPIEVINSNYLSPPSPCTSANSTPDTSPASSGFNGILGVGLYAQDCGSDCVTDATAGSYYLCTSAGNCNSQTTVALAAQVTNPVAALPTDNNGVVLAMNSVTAGGQASSTGTLTFGVGTRSDNATSGMAYAVDPDALEFWTYYSAFSSTELMGSFLDSGSNSLAFPKPSSGIYDCSSSTYSGWFCGSATGSSGTTVSASAINYAYEPGSAQYNSSESSTVDFNVGNASVLFATSNAVFAELAGDTGTSDPYFDWGLPFFFGKTVYVGISGTTTSGFTGTNTGPYWAYH